MPSQDKWDIHWLKIAKVTSELSKDGSTKVGAVIVTPDNRHCSVGYNGFVRGIEETDKKWERPLKYSYVQHRRTQCYFKLSF